MQFGKMQNGTSVSLFLFHTQLSQSIRFVSKQKGRPGMGRLIPFMTFFNSILILNIDKHYPEIIV
nr:MAG TPA: hypothetical protein [Caudoviricetes sp.]